MHQGGSELEMHDGFDIQRSSSCTELTITSANRKTVTAPSTSAVGNAVLAPSKRGRSSLPCRANGSREMKNMMEEMPCGSTRGESPNGRKMREMKNMMEEMPCVSTRGEGPNGRKIEGFLYKYMEEVRIVCVCHGSFLTPAEFVKHAGGGDVDHPLRHIVVNPAPLSLL